MAVMVRCVRVWIDAVGFYAVRLGSLGGAESGAVGLGFLRFVWHGLFWQLWKCMELKGSERRGWARQSRFDEFRSSQVS